MLPLFAQVLWSLGDQVGRSTLIITPVIIRKSCIHRRHDDCSAGRDSSFLAPLRLSGKKCGGPFLCFKVLHPMFRQQAKLAEMFKMRCSESTALSLISTFDGALCGIYGYDRVITQMKFADGLLEYQIEPAHPEIPLDKRVNFDEFYFQLISQSGKHKSAGLKRRSAVQSPECAPIPVYAKSGDGVLTRLRRVGLEACKRANLLWSEIHQRYRDQTPQQLSVPTASSNRRGLRRLFSGNREVLNTDRSVSRVGQLRCALVNATKLSTELAVDLLCALIREL